jgi:DNA-binding HxlR family transcriptional regulator
MCALEGGTLRFQQLRRAVDGVSQKMLTQTLRTLEREGLVQREIYASVPPRVDYTLTPLGRSLSETIVGIRSWAYANMDTIENAHRQAEIILEDSDERTEHPEQTKRDSTQTPD